MLPKLYWLISTSEKYWEQARKLVSGGGQPQFNGNVLKKIEIPLPPMAEQERLVAELEGYRRVIESARQILAHYKPTLRLDPSWPMVKLGEVARIINGRAYKQEDLLQRGKYPVLRVGNFFSQKDWYHSDLELEADKYCDIGDLLYAWSASFGPQIWPGPKVIFHYHIWKMETNRRIDKKYLYYVLERDTEVIKAEGGRGIAMIHLTKAGMEQQPIPLPPLEVQKLMVAELDAERKLVEANRELAARFEKKLQDALTGIWQATKI